MIDDDFDKPLEFFESEGGDIKRVDDPWKILVVDDEEDIHSLTKVVLSDYSFQSRPLEILSAYSGKEALEILKKEKDIALILLDVVMETEDAGLRCVKSIREDLKNETVRIILRTGQPGQAPEQKVIVDYDINDYKSKTEVTAAKLFTVVTASLRAYKYIRTIEKNRIGLEHIIDASSTLFELNSFSLFANGILKQLTSILSLDDSSLYLNSSVSALKTLDSSNLKIIAATGDFSGSELKPASEVLPEEIIYKLDDAIERNSTIFTENSYTGFFKTNKGENTLLYLQWKRDLTEIDKKLITLFGTNVAIAFENLSLNNDVLETQKEIVLTLSELVEGRSRETGNHIKRVSHLAEVIGKKIGLNDEQVEILKHASPMHDIGKIAIPDSILKKPGKLTEDEYEKMKEHTVFGYKTLKNSNKEMIKAAGIIAYEHHEKWDGTGYPRGLKGEEIHLFGRIVALCDVVDALINKRCYKEPWSLESVISFVKKENGKHFDPKIADIFLDSINEFNTILKSFP